MLAANMDDEDEVSQMQNDGREIERFLTETKENHCSNCDEAEMDTTGNCRGKPKGCFTFVKNDYFDFRLGHIRIFGLLYGGYDGIMLNEIAFISGR